VPRSLEFRKELPRNLLGKVLKRELIQEDSGGEQGSDDHGNAEENED
jgi:acyl-coenzyme A synthetase/AMP-(fatty) acid ligase